MKGGELGYTIVKPNAITSSRIVKTNIPNVKLEHFSKKDQLKIKRFGKKRKKYKPTPVGKPYEEPRAEEPLPPKAKRTKASKAPSEVSVETLASVASFKPVEKMKVGKKASVLIDAPTKKVNASEAEAEQLFMDGKITSAQLDEINGGHATKKVFPLYSFPKSPKTRSESITRDQQKLPSKIQQQIIDFRQSSLKQKKAELSKILKTGGLAHWYEAGNKEGHPFTKAELDKATTDDDFDEMFKQEQAAKFLHNIAPQVAKVEGIKPSEVDIGIAGLHPKPVKKIPRYLKREPITNIPVNRVLTDEEVKELEQKTDENAFVHQQLATRQKELTDIQLEKQTSALANREAPKKGKRPPASKKKATKASEPKRRGRPPKVVPVKAEAPPLPPLAPLQPIESPKKPRPPPKKYKLKAPVEAKVEPLVKKILREPVDPVRNKQMIEELKKIGLAEDRRFQKSLAEKPKLPRGAAPKPPDEADELLDALRYYTSVATPRDADPAKVLEAVEEMDRILAENRLPRPPTPRKGRPPKISPVKAEATEEHPSPRRRGRPPKIAPVKAEATEEPPSPVAQVSPPKTRPAPSKRKTKVEAAAEKEVPTPREHASEPAKPVELSPPKKRPAPKRLKAKSQPAQPVVDIEPVESPIVLPLGTELERTPSKRRPPPSKLKVKPPPEPAHEPAPEPAPAPKRRGRPPKITPEKLPYEPPPASPISKQLLDELGIFTQERHLSARKETEKPSVSTMIYSQNRDLIKQALRAAEEAAEAAKSRPAPPRRTQSVAEAPKGKLPPKRTKSVAPDKKWVKMQLTSLENDMIERGVSSTKPMSAKELEQLQRNIESERNRWREANKKYLKDSTAERILRDQPSEITKLLFKKPQSMLFKDTAVLKEKKQAEEKANEEYDYAFTEAPKKEEEFLKSLSFSKVMKLPQSEVMSMSRRERASILTELSDEIESGELAVLKSHLFPGHAALPEDVPSPRRTLDIRQKILESNRKREEERAREVEKMEEERQKTLQKRADEEAARLKREAEEAAVKESEPVKTAEAKRKKAAEKAYFKEFLRNKSVDEVLPFDLIHAQPLTEEVVSHKMWKTKLDLLKNAGLKFKDYKANPDLKAAIDMIMARAHEREVKHKLEHPGEEPSEEEKQQRLDDEQRVRTLWEQSLAATMADSEEEEEQFELYDPTAQLDAENEAENEAEEEDETLPLGDVELEENKPEEPETEEQLRAHAQELREIKERLDEELDEEEYKRRHEKYSKKLPTSWLTEESEPITTFNFEEDFGPDPKPFDPFEVPYEEPPSPASTEVSFGSTASPYTPRSPARWESEGSGLNFGKLKWGSFSRQLKDYNKKHSSKLSLEQFAHAVISSPKHFDKRTQKRARFYLDIILHQKGKGLELKSHHNNIMPMIHSVRHSVQHPAMASPHPDFVLTPNAQANIAAFHGGALKDDMMHMYHRAVPKTMRASVEHLARETGKHVLRHPEVKKARKDIREKYESVVPKEMRPAIAKVAYTGLHHAMEGNGMEGGSMKTRMQKTFNKVVPNKKVREALVDLGKTATREVVNSAPITKIRRKVRDEYNKAVPQALKDPLEDLGKATLAYGKRKAGYGKGLKGSDEMKKKMARLRAMRKSKGGAIPAPPSRSPITDPSLL
jgi:hypothetical protein